MKNFYSFLLVCILALGAYVPQAVAGTLTLTDSADIRDAQALDDALGNVSSAVTGCMDMGRNNTQCQCENLDIIHEFNGLYKETIVLHPDWKEQSIYYQKPNGQGVTIMFSALRRQSEAIDNLVCE
ncbi:MAG: hypothetical protein ACRBDL_01115 [Alphaproteobacteria bacterium]